MSLFQQLNQICVDSQVRDLLLKIQKHITVLEQASARVSSRAEVFGAVQQVSELNRCSGCLCYWQIENYQARCTNIAWYWKFPCLLLPEILPLWHLVHSDQIKCGLSDVFKLCQENEKVWQTFFFFSIQLFMKMLSDIWTFIRKQSILET